jgi:hypothetical protein
LPACASQIGSQEFAPMRALMRALMRHDLRSLTTLPVDDDDDNDDA